MKRTELKKYRVWYKIGTEKLMCHVDSTTVKLAKTTLRSYIPEAKVTSAVMV